MSYSKYEKSAAFLCVIINFIAAVSITPFNSFFYENFTFYWLPHVAIIILAAIIYPRPAVISGAALTLSIYLTSFNAWIDGPDPAMAWLIYIYSAPGAVLGAAAGAFKMKNKIESTAFHVSASVAAAMFIGIFLCLSPYIVQIYFH